MAVPGQHGMQISEVVGVKFRRQQRLDAVITITAGAVALVAAQSDEDITVSGDSGAVTVTGPAGADLIFVDGITPIAADASEFFTTVRSATASTGVIVFETSTTFGTVTTVTGTVHLSWRLKGV